LGLDVEKAIDCWSLRCSRTITNTQNSFIGAGHLPFTAWRERQMIQEGQKGSFEEIEGSFKENRYRTNVLI
jgi:hypothetical protein